MASKAKLAEELADKYDLSGSEAEAIVDYVLENADAPRAFRVPSGKVEFKVDTRHPEYGEIKKGEVLEFSGDYVSEYISLGMAEMSDKKVSRTLESK